MSEKRFTITDKEWISYNGGYAYTVSNGQIEFSLWEDEEDAQKVCDYLNEQQATIRKLQDFVGQSDYENAKLRQEIKELKAQLREKEEDEQLYANEIVKLNKEAKEVLDFKSLGGDY